jgi:hypothetical protein
MMRPFISNEMIMIWKAVFLTLALVGITTAQEVTPPATKLEKPNFEFKDGFRLPDRYISKYSQDQLEIKNKYLSELGELWNVDIKILHNDDV